MTTDDLLQGEPLKVSTRFKTPSYKKSKGYVKKIAFRNKAVFCVLYILHFIFSLQLCYMVYK